MFAQSKTGPPKHLVLRERIDSRELTMDEVVPCLVGHTIKEVERELILHTLIHHCGSRTRSAHVLGISIRCKNELGKVPVKPKKRFSAEQIVTLLRQIEVSIGQGEAASVAMEPAHCGFNRKAWVVRGQVATIASCRLR